MIHLKMIFRSWWRNKLSTLISVISLTIGLTCSIILILFVLGEYETANSMGNTDNLYILETKDPFAEDENAKSNHTIPNAAYLIKENYADVEKFVTIKTCEWDFKDAVTKNKYSSRLYAVTDEFLNIFSIPVEIGDLASTLRSENEVAVTQKFMIEKFGRAAVIGDIIRAEANRDYWANGKPLPIKNYNLTITTILSEPVKSVLNYQALTKLPIEEIASYEGFSFFGHISFVQLNPQSSVDDLGAKIIADSIINKYNMVSFVPFSDVYFDKRSKSDIGSSSLIVTRDPSILTIGLGIALLVLTIAAFNHINITMTRARARLKNIAGQRIFGATKWNVRFQTLLDTTLIVLISFGFALLIINAVSPQFNSFMDCKIDVLDIFKPSSILILSLLLLTLSVLPSLYILLKVEVTNLSTTFKNPLGNKSTISSVMVIAQFTVSVILIVVGINISRQMDFIVSQRPVAHSILYIRDGNGNDMSADFCDRARRLAGVDSYTSSSILPTTWNSSNGVVLTGGTADENMVDFYGLKLLEGRSFNSTDSANCVIVNQTLLKNQNIEEPHLGQQFDFNGKKRIIIGVIEDFMFADAHKAIQSLAYFKADYVSNWRLYLKVSGDVETRIAELRDLWNQSDTKGGSFEVKTLAKVYEDMHTIEMRLKTMIDIFMFVSIILTALGLFGLAFYTVGRRAREIAVRKVHGSTTGQLILRLCRTFAVWVGIAFVIAVPIAYYFSNDWLSTFVYRVPMTAWVFALTAGIAAAITFLTVIFQTWYAASANPAESIKNE